LNKSSKQTYIVESFTGIEGDLSNIRKSIIPSHPEFDGMQEAAENCMPPNFHSFKRWDSLTHKKTKKLLFLLQGMFMPQFNVFWGTPISNR